MSKIIPTLPSQGKQTLLNVQGSTPTGGRTLQAGVPTQPGWNPHDAVAASGQRNGVPSEMVAAPQNTIPGEPMNHPAEAAPAFPVAGRDASYERESGA
jgi:hypothetical protein